LGFIYTLTKEESTIINKSISKTSTKCNNNEDAWNTLGNFLIYLLLEKEYWKGEPSGDKRIPGGPTNEI